MFGQDGWGRGRPPQQKRAPLARPVTYSAKAIYTMNPFKTLIDKWRASKQKAADKAAFSAQLTDAVADGRFSKEEVDSLYALQDQLGLTQEDVASMRVQAFAKAFAVAKADGSITEQEELELQEIQEHLDIADAEIAPTEVELRRFRLLREIVKGHVPVVSVPGLVLQKLESAYWIEPASILEEKVINRQFVGGSRGVSIRIMKGVSYRVGAYRGHVESQTGIVAVSTGELVITSKRVIFRGDKKGFNTRFDKLLNVEMASNGVTLTDGSSKPRVVQFRTPANADIVGAILSHAINRFGS
jgi:tellurite resistance protein